MRLVERNRLMHWRCNHVAPDRLLLPSRGLAEQIQEEGAELFLAKPGA
jgi:hypothetical protein